MSWNHEVIRALLLTLGTSEIITNVTYLAKKNGLILARKQHGELPPNTTDKQIKIKVLCVLFFGVVFFAVALSSYILHTDLQVITSVVLALFMIYGITEASYYRYWKTCGFALLTIVLFSVQMFI